MKLTHSFLALSLLIGFSAASSSARDLEGLTREAGAIFEAKQHSADPIPAAVLARAKAVGIIKVIEAGIGIGGSGGEGVIFGRTAAGWSAPVFFQQSGGSLGLQIGVHAKRYIYVFNSNGTVAIFTGPQTSHFHSLAQYTAEKNHDAEVVDGGLSPDLAVYGQAEGAYAGATVGGVQVGESSGANQKAYGTDDAPRILSGAVPAPAYAEPLRQALTKASRLPGKDK